MIVAEASEKKEEKKNFPPYVIEEPRLVDGECTASVYENPDTGNTLPHPEEGYTNRLCAIQRLVSCVYGSCDKCPPKTEESGEKQEEPKPEVMDLSKKVRVPKIEVPQESVKIAA